MITGKDKSIRYGITRDKIIRTFNKNTEILSNGCIVWTKVVNNNGYGLMCIAIKNEAGNYNRNPVFVHRFAWALKYGMDALPNGNGPERKGDRMVLNHTCYNPKCVNTGHLEVITQLSNVSKNKRKPKND